MPQDLKIKTPDGFHIYGRLEGPLTKPLVITVHGLPGDVHDVLHVHAAEWFTTHGFSSFRFNLYDWHDDGRQLIDCTLRTHANDLDTVVRYFRRKGVKKIFVAGHSYGGPTILHSKDQAFDAATLWDPSYDISFAKTKYGYPGGKFVKALNGYFMRWGINVVVGKKMANEADQLDWDSLPRNFRRPLQIIAAQKGVLVKGAKAYFEHAHEPKRLDIIKGATHYFDDKTGMEQKLFATTKKWFEKF